MVDARYINLDSTPDDIRYRIFDYLWNVKKVGSRDLRIRSYQANKIKNRKRRITNDLLRRMIEMLTPDEYAEPVEGVTAVKVDPNTFVKILTTAVADLTLKPILVEFVKNRLAAEIFTETTRYTVTKQDLEEFKVWLKRRARLREKGIEDLSRDTVTESWEEEFIPRNEDDIRAEIKLAMERTGVKFELYKLRSFFISWMILENKILGEIVAVLTGQTSLAQVEVTLRHYFGGSIEKLRELYDKRYPEIL
ncbi:MAG: hypothetical protein LRS41_03250 [Caldisphaeraceae archaeon]|nr:hypothetical protein [Caldisphaeraceae archaeon]